MRGVRQRQIKKSREMKPDSLKGISNRLQLRPVID